MKDSDDLTAHPTAQYKYIMDEKTQADSMLERAKRAAARHANAKEYAFACYRCREHGIRYLKFEDQDCEGPEQFEIICGACGRHPKKKYASLAQVEKFARACPDIGIPSVAIPTPPEPPKPVLQNEAAREAWEKLFGKD